MSETIVAGPMTTAAEPDGAPRLASLDILRGVAILGILFMNINDMGGALFAGWVDIGRYGMSDADRIAFFLRNTLADGTARCLLEMLFGAGMVILTERAEKAAESRWAVLRGYYWRNIVLFLFGLVHVFILLWPGDILHTYGIAALIAVLFRRLSARWLLGVGLVFALLQLGGGGTGYVMTRIQDQRVAAIEARQKAGQPTSKEDAKVLADANKSKAERDKRHREMDARMAAEDKARAADTGTFMSWARAQWDMFLYLEGMVLEPLWIWEAAATMLIGAALFKWGVIQGSRSTRFYLLLTLACYAFGLTTRAIGALDDLADYDGPSVTWATQELARLATTLGHVGLVHLLLRTATGAGLLRPFEAAGRTALTLYIAQTILCLWILYPPFALGLYGRHSWAVWMSTAVAVNALLLWAANVYLRHYRIAPIEWAWRSIVAGRSLPIRKTPRTPAAQPA
ncbi:DUF418 domain-containing protein [Sphingomonas sp. DT-204]|uniref:DUF418 domain-containing protein n=1 Tax=Sphingomonas sp. DT-204 TaxID=3396166 RepID=UPI003F196C87